MNRILFSPVMYEMTPEDFSFDYAQRVPFLSIAAMIFGMVLSIAVPIILFLYVRRRYRLDPQAIIYGLLSFMLGGYLLPNLLIGVLQWANAQTGIFSSVSVLYYILVGVLMAGLELAAIYIGMKFAGRRNPLNLGTALAFGVIFSAFPLLTQTISYLGSYLSVSLTVNQGGLYTAVESMIAGGESTREDIESLLEGMEFLFESNFGYYLLMTMDVLLMLPFRVGICAILFGVLYGRLPKNLTWAAVGLEAVYAAVTFLRYSGILQDLAVAELCNLLLAAAAVFVGFRLISQFLPEDWAKLKGKPDPSLRKKKDDNKPGSGTGHKMPKIVMPKD